MSTRRVALSLAALTALATMPVLAGTPAGASGAIVSPTARGEDNGVSPASSSCPSPNPVAKAAADSAACSGRTAHHAPRPGDGTSA